MLNGRMEAVGTVEVINLSNFEKCFCYLCVFFLMVVCT